MSTGHPAGDGRVRGLSVVIPCFNEEDVLHALVDALTTELARVAEEFEVILVDDGSADRTLEVMREVNAADPRFRYLSLSRNFGKEAAMLAGLSQARLEAVAIMDADLQHPPELLAHMVPMLDQGYDQVVARRTRTGDAPVRTFLSRSYYRLINHLVDVQLDDGVGDFRVLSRKAVRALLALGEYNRFSKGLFAWIGFPTAVVDYENVVRGAGASKWRTRDLVEYGIDGVLSFNNRPLRLGIYFGALVAAVAVAYALWVLGDAIIFGNPVPGYVTIICLVAGLGGIQMVVLGIIGEYLGRIYAEVKRRPHFLLRESSEGAAATPVAILLGPEHEQFAVEPVERQPHE